MRKIILLTAILSVSLAMNAYSETAPAAPVNSTPVSAAPVSEATPTTVNNDKPKSEAKPAAKKSDESQSVYDSIKSGWNSFIDTLAGPATNK